MPQFELQGKWHPDFKALDLFTQGYIEAMFFTESGDEQLELEGKGFEDLAPATLDKIKRDCREFLKVNRERIKVGGINSLFKRVHNNTMTAAGNDFWFTRNGHGCGFWDGGWPEPMAKELTDNAKVFGAIEPYTGDDGKIYFFGHERMVA